jgi:hypothetical protein
MLIGMNISQNFYIATFRAATDLTEFKTVTTDSGVQIRIVKYPDGSLKTQSILFPKDKYTLSSAKIHAFILEKSWV